MRTLIDPEFFPFSLRRLVVGALLVVFLAPSILASVDLLKGNETQFVGQLFISLHIVNVGISFILMPFSFGSILVHLSRVGNSILPMHRHQLPFLARINPINAMLYPHVLSLEGQRAARLVKTGFIVLFVVAYGIAATNEAREYFSV